MLKSGVSILTLKFPSPKRFPTEPTAAWGAWTGARTWTRGAGATLTRSGATTLLEGAGRLATRDLEAPETAEFTVCETRGEIWEIIWATMSDWAELDEEEVEVATVGLGPGGLS